MNMKPWLTGTTLLLSACLTPSAFAALTLDVYNPGKTSTFPVTSTLIYGDHDAVLIDAQFERKDAQRLVDKLKASGKTLKMIYISHSDPDYYFGLDVLTSHFPQAKVLSSPATAYLIDHTKQQKLAFWKETLKDQAPENLITPMPYDADYFELEGERIDIHQAPNDPARGYLWIPSLRTLLGGVSVYDNVHVWLADTPTAAGRFAWQKGLEAMQQRSPLQIIPGHYISESGNVPYSPESLAFTQRYLHDFEQVLATHKGSAYLISQMKHRYPHLQEEDSLTLSAKALSGEMVWTAPPAYPPATKQP